MITGRYKRRLYDGAIPLDESFTLTLTDDDDAAAAAAADTTHARRPLATADRRRKQRVL